MVKMIVKYNVAVEPACVESMLEEFNVSALKSASTLLWERREVDEKEMPAVGKLLWVDRTDLRCAI